LLPARAAQIDLSRPASLLPERVTPIVDPDHDDNYLYRLPYGENVSYSVLQAYGSKLSHRGSEYFTVDFRMAEGTEVYSAREGIVAATQDSHSRSCWKEGCGRYANFVVVLHSDGTTGEYFHLQAGSVAVRDGQRVARGQLLARSGNTGLSTTPHLHFGVYRLDSRAETQSIAVRFSTRDGIVEPRQGARYTNVHPAELATKAAFAPLAYADGFDPAAIAPR
jgi:murein DD-endopeptidase MepM/ murein hydrolase activator NlpD